MRDVSERAEKPAFVISIDQFQGLPVDFAHRFPRADLADDLGFEQSDNALSESIILGSADYSHRWNVTHFDEALCGFDRRIVGSAIRMLDKRIVIMCFFCARLLAPMYREQTA